MTRSSVRPGDGKTRRWAAPNGQAVPFPLIVTAWEDHPVLHERLWTVSAKVDLVDRRPSVVDVHFLAEDGLDLDRLQRDFRWKAPVELVTVWVPDVLAAGGDFTELEPPADWWTPDIRHELTDDFLGEIADEYLRQGRGYAKAMAIKYRTTERTIRSWVDKARQRGVLGPAPGRGRIGGTFAVVMTEED